MGSISLRGIKKVYAGDVVAVHDFNLEIEDKEFVILVGPSGCGKSTTLRMIAGLEEISAGELYIADKLVNDVPPKDRNIAMVFQNYALYPHMTVFKNMAFGLELRKVPKDIIKQKVTEAARVLEIEPLLNRKPKALSGGQRQRVALGRAMVRDPEVFLLDEPLSNLDAKLRTAMRAEITRLHQRLGTTFVYVTHDQVEAMTMGDRIVVMKDGYIMQIDTPQALYDRPANLFVAGFIGSPQMNFIDGVLESENGNYFVRVPNGDTLPVLPGKCDEQTLKENLGKEVVAGIRAEAIKDTAFYEVRDKDTLLDVDVELSELMGSETFLYLQYNNQKVTAKVPNVVHVKMGTKMRIAVQCDKMHLFSKETEQVIFN